MNAAAQILSCEFFVARGLLALGSWFAPRQRLSTPTLKQTLRFIYTTKEDLAGEALTYDIIIGRSKEDKEKYGTAGTILLGKHYVTMGQTVALSNKIYLDMIRSHVVFVCGKRGGGKSYTLGVIAEGMANIEENVRRNLSIILLDTMGIFWTMKYPNMKEKELLDQWQLDPKALKINIFTPLGFYKKSRDEGIPTDYPFSIRPAELLGSDWNTTFGIEQNSASGVMIERIIHNLKEGKEDKYTLKDIMKAIESDKEVDVTTKAECRNHFLAAQSWGIFNEQGTPLADLAKPGEVTVLDLSAYATEENGWAIKALVTGLVSQKLFIDRVVARKEEEFKQVYRDVNYLAVDESAQMQETPLVWLVLDEAHEFLPNTGKTLASDPLITILREGRQPGISLILASQQPGKIHTDVMTQSDIIISHRITAKIDTDALATLMQSYMRVGLDKMLDGLPRMSGAALILDDNNEKMFPIQVRPRFTWHGGSSPIALKKEKELFEF